MTLAIRMVLYAIFAGLASVGVVDFNPNTGDVSFTLQSLEALLLGITGYVATFGASRIAKARGGST